jgi:exodeoxyribonuclease VII small subunit
MTERTPGEFETKVVRLEAIVRQLETGDVPLDEAVALFQEGKVLSAECEALLKSAQESVERAMNEQSKG